MVACFLVSCVSGAWAGDDYIIVPAKKSFVSAETRLKGLAEKAEKSRMESGMYGLGLGALYIGLGSSCSNSYYYGNDYSTPYYIMGGGMMLLGAYSLLFPSELERGYSEVKTMSLSTVEQRASREGFAAQVLYKGAEETAKGRILSSGVLSASGLIMWGSSPMLGAIFVGCGITGYFVKSDIERSYEEYEQDKKLFMEGEGGE